MILVNLLALNSVESVMRRNHENNLKGAANGTNKRVKQAIS